MLVNQYEALSRWPCYRFFSGSTSSPEKSKDEISSILTPTRSDKYFEVKMEILAALLIFKFSRQCIGNNLNRQEDMLIRIQDLVRNTPELNLNLNDLMIYAKNESCLIQRKVPYHLKNSIQALLPQYEEQLASKLIKLCPDGNDIIPVLSLEPLTLFARIEKFFNENIASFKLFPESIHSPEEYGPLIRT